MRNSRNRSPEYKRERQQRIAERREQVEKAITEALQHEGARHDAAVENMHRLRALRLERDEKQSKH